MTEDLKNSIIRIMVYYVLAKTLPPKEKLLSKIPEPLIGKGLAIREFDTIKEAKVFIRKLKANHSDSFELSVWKETGTPIKI